MKKFLHGKDNIIQTKHQATQWETIFTNYMSDRELLSKIYKELKNLYIKKQQ